MISDAPSHEKQYHNENQNVNDDYLNTTDVGSLEKATQWFKSISNLSFFCFPINNTTDKMFSVMKDNLPNLFITEIVKLESFIAIILLSLTQTLLRHGLWEESVRLTGFK